MGVFAIADIISGGIALANKFADYFRKKDDQNTGRKLQVSDEAVAAVKGDVNAQVTAEDVARLSDDDLDRELRGPQSPSRPGK